MFFIVLYALYLFYYQESLYARIHVLVLIDTVFLGVVLLSCILLAADWLLALKYLFLWFFVFFSGAVNVSLLSQGFYKSQGKKIC